MKFGGHQSFHLRDQWLNKGIRYVIESSFKSPANTEPFIGKTALKNAMEEMGVGLNMAESIKYWLKATRLTKASSNGLVLTDIAHKIFKQDPYFEQDGTLFLIHYLLTTNKEEATAWYWFFNCFSATEFEKESLTNAFYAYIQIKTDRKVRDSTLEKDLQCLLRMYQAVEWTGNKNPETKTPSLWTKYGWIKQKGLTFIRSKLHIDDINIHIFAFILYLFWKENLGQPESFQIDDLTNKEKSPGRIFQFSLEEINDLIELCAKKLSYLNYSRTGGYFIIQPNEKKLKKALNNYYKEMN